MLIQNPWKNDYAASAKMRLQAAMPQALNIGTSLKNGRFHWRSRGTPDETV
jgi:hypothetical protein